MKFVINLGDPGKDFAAVSQRLFGTSVSERCKLTGVRWFAGGGIGLTTPAYGSAMVVDTMTELIQNGHLTKGDAVVLVGSMGSLVGRIALGDVVLPEPSRCAYYGFDGEVIYQDRVLRDVLKAELELAGTTCEVYSHGSSYAVFDRHLDHANYVSSVYPPEVEGVDCGEVFLGLELCGRYSIRAAAVLFCSDSPSNKISGIGATEFTERARKMDAALNAAAVRALEKT